MTAKDSIVPRTQRGPSVWLDMDQAALDDAYDQTVWAPNMDQVALRRAESCAWAIERFGPPERIAYGPSDIEKLSVLRTGVKDAPIVVFIHGGAWRSGTTEQTTFMAENVIDAGAHFVAADFVDVITAGGDLRPMIDQVRRAIAWVASHAADIGGDANRLYLCSHSSGSHLSGCALTTDWTTFGLSSNPIRAALLSSGMYDLTPVRLSKRGEYVAFTDAIVHSLSSVRHLDHIRCPVILTYGTCESPEFQRQSRVMYEAMRQAGKAVDLRIGKGLNHFEIQETFGSPYGFLGRILRDMLKAPVGSGPQFE